MISIEAARDGFNLMFGGRRLLAHSRRSPCVEIGWSELSFAQRRGAFRLARRKSSWRPLRSFKVVENGPDFTAIDFEGLLRMAIRLEDGALRLSFARFDAGVELFRLRFQAWPGERVYGGGARLSRLDLKGLALPLWAEDRQGGGEGALSRAVAALRGFGPRPLSSRCPIPAFVSSRNYWLVLDSSARSELDFRRRGRGVVESWAVPREIVVGTAPDAPSLLASLGSAVGKQPRLPSWAYDGAILGVSIAPGLGTAVNALSRDTAQLPFVQLAPPESVIGTNTVMSIQAGVVHGYAGLVTHLVARMKEEIGGEVKVVATGGLCRVVAGLVDCFDAIDPDLTLDGLALVADYC